MRGRETFGTDLSLLFQRVDDARVAVALVHGAVGAQEVIVSVAFHVPYEHTCRSKVLPSPNQMSQETEKSCLNCSSGCLEPGYGGCIDGGKMAVDDCRKKLFSFFLIHRI